MAQESGNTLGEAKQILISSGRRVLKEAIGGKDRQDIYQFRQASQSSFDLHLSHLKTNASVALLNAQGSMIARSKRLGLNNEQINRTLRPGTYYVAVSSRSRQSTSYQLQLFSRSNISPLLNTGLSLRQGKTAALSRKMLRFSSTGQPNKITYTLTRLPEAGRLTLKGKPLRVNAQFTQADIDSRRLSYTHTVRRKQLNQRNVRGFERSESTIVWEEFDGNDYEIFLYDDLTQSVRQLSNNKTDDKLEIVADAGVVWQSVAGNISTLFFYNRSQKNATQLATDDTTDLIENTVQSVTAIGVVWSRSRFFSSGQLFFYNPAVNQTVQLTDLGLFEAVNDDKIFWENGVVGELSQLLFYDVSRATTTPISGVGDSNSFEPIFDSAVVWRDGMLFGENQLFLYSFTTGMNTALTDVGSHGIVKSENSKIVWQRSVGNDNELFLYDQSTGLTTQITDDNLNNSFEGWLDNGLVWSGFPSSIQRKQLFIYDFATRVSRPFTELGFNNFQNISDANIFWSSFDGVDAELYSYNSKTTAKVQLTADDVYNQSDSRFDSVANANAAWKTFDGNDHEIFFFNASRNSVQQLTDNSLDDTDAKIANSLIIWQQFDDNDDEILLHNTVNNTTIQITQNLTNDFFEAFWNSKLFWRNKDGIYLGSFVKSDRFEFKVSDRLGKLTRGSFNILLR
ncbi:hypothetical protein IFO70_23490 [Phormidium tenue FACHB-886]|nr:hypothetical protein [Phormidium tenue FACHB-886]